MNRHLYGDALPVRANIPDCVAVEPGDLMFVCDSNHHDLNKALRTLSGLTGYVYPMIAGSTVASFYSGVSTFCAHFLGVALDISNKGSTDTIAVATAGVFEFPLVAQAGTTIGKVVTAQPSGYSSGARTTASYQVKQAGGGVSVGWCVRNEAGAETIHFMLRSGYGPGGIATYNAA